MQRSKRRKWLVWLSAGVGLLAVAGAVVVGRGSGGPPAPADKADRPAVAVTTESVTVRPIRRTVAVVGSLYGWDEVSLTPKVEGRVVKVYHDVGDVVRPGEPLVDLDPTDYQLAADEARRSLELELAKLGLKELPRELDVAALPSVMRVVLLEKNAASRNERLLRLGRNGAASPEDREQAQTDHAVARTNFRQAILEAQATLAAARYRQAALATALQRLRDVRVLAPPAEGLPSQAEYVVSQRGAYVGEIVRALPNGTNTLFKLIIDRPLKLMATVPERHRAKIKLGQPTEFEVEAYPGRKFTACVSRINPVVDRASRTFQIEAKFANADRELSAGSFARANILTRVDGTARTVPEESLISFAGVTKVFLVRDGKAREAQVRPGVPLDVPAPDGARHTWVEVEGDLPVGAVVVTSGHAQLADGMAVRVR